MKKLGLSLLLVVLLVSNSFGQIIKINVDTVYQFSHNSFITTDMAMKSNDYTIDNSFITETTYTIDFENMTMSCEDFTGNQKTFNIRQKNSCDCVCNFTFEAINNGNTDIVDVIVDASSNNKNKYVTYFRWNSFDKKGLSKTFGWFDSNTKVF